MSAARRRQATEHLAVAERALAAAGKLLVKETFATVEDSDRRLMMSLSAKCAVINNHVEDMRKALGDE